LRSIRAKLAVFTFAAVSGAVMLMAAISAWTGLNERYQAKQAELQGIAAAIAVAVSQPLAAGDRDGVARSLSSVGRIPGITYARVRDHEDRTVQQFGFGVVVADRVGILEANKPVGPLSAVYLATYPVAVPIVSGGRSIGELMLIADLSALRGLVMERVGSALLAGLAALLVVLALARRFLNSIVNPIASLTAAMDEVRRTKDYTGKVALASNDEIGRMVDTFNGMLVEVRERDRQIAFHRDHLESQVVERTAELAEAKCAAEAASAAKSDFLATMSHEIRTPMNGMLVMAELMATSGLAPRTQRYAEVLLSSGKTLLAIINDILDFSKIEAGKLDLESIPASPRAIVDDVVRLFYERAVAKNLDIAAEINWQVPDLIAIDPVRLTQVVSNLVNNALKFTECGGVTIKLGFAIENNGGMPLLRLAVTDTGIGIPADKLATIFEAFAQADQSTTRRFGGTGIGLTICRKLVAAMGGEISVSSEVGKGSTFSFAIPVDVLEASKPPLRMASEKSGRVIVALPPSPTRAAICHALDERGLDVAVLAIADIGRVDLAGARAVISDWASLSAMHTTKDAAGWPLAVAVVGVGESRYSASQTTSAPDIVLDIPLVSSEVADCLDRIVGGTRSAGSGVRAQSANVQTIRKFNGIRVLAADDNAVNREVLIEALARLDAEVVCVGDGAAAVAAVRDGSFDIVLMDCSMPVMDGFQATRTIRALEMESGRTPLPIVALTAHVVGGKADEWRDAGMNEYLTKPYTLRALAECLGRALPARLGVEQPLHSASTDIPEAPGATMAATDRRDLIDADVLDSIREMSSPGDGLVERVIGLYAGHAPRALAALIAAERDGDPQSIAETAHALKSLSRNIGAVAVGDLCDAIEGAARAGEACRDGLGTSELSRLLPATIAALDHVKGRAAHGAPPKIGQTLLTAS
jgi:two-component system sensor histidine kinase BarA